MYFNNIIIFFDKIVNKIKPFINLETPFTDYNCLSIFVYLFYNMNYNYDLYNLYAIIACNSYSILTTFHLALIFDIDVFKRMQKKMNITPLTFHLGNAILHIYPCYYLYIYPPINISYYHGIISSFSYFLWLYFYSDDKLNLSKIYVPLKTYQWFILHNIFIITSLLTPYTFKKFII